MPGRRKGRARPVVIVTLVVVAVLAFVGLTLRLFVFPDLNEPVHSDAIAVLGSPGAPGIDEGEKLAREGYAPNVVFSLTPYFTCSTFVGLLPHQKVFCFRPHPATTQGEAQAIGGLASVHGWHRIIVVMPTTQASRARLRIGRCYPGQLLEVGTAPQGWWAWLHGIAYEWGALMKALILQRSC